MSRRLVSWAQPDRRRRPRRRMTWLRDLLAFAPALFRPRGERPGGAPPRDQSVFRRLVWNDLRRTPDLRNMLAWRLDYQVVGLDGLRGLQAPVILAVNEVGAIDWQVLRPMLPAALRTTTGNPSRSLARGMSVAMFSETPVVEGEVGEFAPVIAELANQHNVPIVPVALVGTFKLNEVLGLALHEKPRVSVRFGAPVYVRGRGIARATAEVQAAVEQLFRTGELTWWTVQKHASSEPSRPETMPRWRRLWQQTAPRPVRSRRRIWADDTGGHW